MNKRQLKKRGKIIKERVKFFGEYSVVLGRQSGKKHLEERYIKSIIETCVNKSYKDFNTRKASYIKWVAAIEIMKSNLDKIS